MTPRSDLLGSDVKLAEVVSRLVATYQPERLYLFGSRARGETGAGSDYDILVIMPDGTPAERREPALAYQALWGTGTAADVIVWESSSFYRRARVVASLPAVVLREGCILYAA